MRNLELPGRSPVHSPNGMACSSHPLSSQAAIDILKAGGTAMDAAIAACAVQCVVEPGSTGIGGDCFALYAPLGSSDVIGFNGSGGAAAAASASWYQDQRITKFDRMSPHAVTLPGAVDAWAQLLKDHGRMTLKDVLQPAIEYARGGYPIASRVHSDFVAAKDLLKQNETSARIFLPNGKVPAIGAMHYQPEMAETLQTIADHGRDAFYTGPIAQDIVDCLHERGGLHTMQDFASVAGEYVTPITTDFRGHTIHECPPNGQGVIALLLLNMMSELEIDAGGPISTKRLHHELEACRLAYAARAMYIGDPSFSDIPVEELLSQDYAKRLVGMIKDEASDPAGDVALTPHKDTVYISVVDKDRNACSFINTVFHGFGSGITAPKTGIVLQNRGHGFSLDPSHPNCIEGGKRPLHTIIPGMVSKGGKTVMPFGVMGGQYQAFGHMQFLTRFFDYGYDIQQAMDLPRTMVDPLDGSVEIEKTIPEGIRNELTALGHRLQDNSKAIGGSQAIWIDWDQGVLTGGSDPRKDGCAIGY